MTKTTYNIDDLIEIMRRLRDPNGGCPWDVEQTFETIAPYTIEEAYEVAEAIAKGDMAELKDELGDLLFQVVFHAQMADEDGAFNFADVVTAVSDKMTRRHPHVFGDATIESAAAQTNAWENQKAKERAAKVKGGGSALDDVPAALPALIRAEKVQKRAARDGFDWPDESGPRAKIDEELAELAAAKTEAEQADEMGDLLFAVVNLARHMKIDPEEALRQATRKFEGRYRSLEDTLRAKGETPAEHDIDTLEALWQAAKQETD